MVKVLAKANVAYPDAFLATLTGYDRKPYGELSFDVKFDGDAHNQAYVTFTWNTLQEAQGFWTSEAGLAHIATWHSVSMPEFSYISEASLRN
jgi:hypothetical protein